MSATCACAPTCRLAPECCDFCRGSGDTIAQLREELDLTRVFVARLNDGLAKEGVLNRELRAELHDLDHERDVAIEAARVAGEALRARDADLDDERRRVAALTRDNEDLFARNAALRWRLAHP